MANEHNLGLAYALYDSDKEQMPMGDPLGGSSEECFYQLYWSYANALGVFVCPAKKTTIITPDDVTAYAAAGGDSASGLSRLYDFGYSQDAGDDWGADYHNGIPTDSDPMRAVLADISTGNHVTGSNILFFDTHVEFADKEAVDVVANPKLPNLDEDPNIYTDEANDQAVDCDLNHIVP